MSFVVVKCAHRISFVLPLSLIIISLSKGGETYGKKSWNCWCRGDAVQR